MSFMPELQASLVTEQEGRLKTKPKQKSMEAQHDGTHSSQQRSEANTGWKTHLRYLV